jgi:hypothetical protein
LSSEKVRPEELTEGYRLFGESADPAELTWQRTERVINLLSVSGERARQYARLSGKPVAALRQAMKTWLPIAIVRYFLLMGGPTSERWRRMMQRAEAALRPQD